MRKFLKKSFLELKTSKLTKAWPFWFLVLVWLALAAPYFLEKITPFPATYLVTRFPPWQYFYSMPVKNGAMPDVLSQLFPWRKLAIEFLKKREFPLWNPYVFGGNPHLANFQSAPFHPFNFLFFLLPFATAWKTMVLLQPILAAVFTYLFCRQIKISQIGSLVSGLAFGFCGFLVVWMAYGTLGFALLWLPLVLYGIEKSLPRATILGSIAIGFGIAFSLFSGHFQTSLYLILAAFLYLLFRRAWSGLLPFFLGLSLAAPQVLPAVEFYRLAPRSEIFLKGEVIPWRYLITLVAPDFYGNPVTRNDWFGHYAEWAGFGGVLPLILAFYAVLRRKPVRLINFFTGLGILALALALPTPFLDWLIKAKIPVLSTSAASRIICLFSFSLAILAGLGLDQWQKDWERKKFLKIIFLFLAGGTIFFLGVWGFLLVSQSLPVDKLVVAKRNFILPTILFFSFVGLSLVILFFSRLGFKKKILISSSVLMILFLTAFDLWRFAKKWLPADSEEYLYPRLPVIEFLEEEVGHNRVFGNFGNELAMVFKIPSLEGYDPLYNRRYGELVTTASDGMVKTPSRSTAYLDKGGEYTEKILRLLGVKYLIHAKDDDRHVWAFPYWDYPGQFVEVYDSWKYQVFENKKALPRAFLAYDYQVVKDGQAIVDQLYAVDLEKTLVLEEEIFLAGGEETGGGGTVVVRDYQPNRVVLSASTPKEGLLFLSDNFYPGWKAFLNGQETKIYRADYSFRAVKVPPGDQEVVFSYQPESFKWGLAMSGSALAAFLLVLVKQKRKKRGQP